MRFSVFVFLFLSHSASADTVIFIGGYGSTADNMSCWKKGAENQAAYSGYKFKTIKYPAGVTGYRNAITEKTAAKQIAELVNYINSRPNERFVIAAHSTGSDIAFLAAKRLNNPNNVDYVNLAGWSVPKHMYKLHKVTSLGDPSSYGNCPVRPRWCRHFSLVNKTPPSNLDLGNLADGYSGCNSNLAWLPKKAAVVTAGGDSKPDAPSSAPLQLTPTKMKAILPVQQAPVPKPTAKAIGTKANDPAFGNGASGSFDDDTTPAKK